VTTPLTERVARAQCLACGLDPDFEVWDLNERKYRPYWTVRIPEARASILAMREPSPAMLDAFVSRALQVQVSGEGGWTQYAIGQWQQMVDAALREQP
jgi:hypothetical protein